MWAKMKRVVPSIPTSRAFLSWACGAAGSALPWHGRGRRFDPDQVHQFLSSLAKDKQLTLRLDFNGSPVCDGLPYFVDLFIGHGYATIRPISEPMGRPDGAVAVRQSVDEHIATRKITALLRHRPIASAGIGNMN